MWYTNAKINGLGTGKELLAGPAQPLMVQSRISPRHDTNLRRLYKQLPFAVNITIV